MSGDALAIARTALARLREATATPASTGEESEVCEERLIPPAVVHLDLASQALAWRRTNAGRLTAADLAAGRDAGGYCVEHRRWLSWPEQKRGACSWCVPVDPEREPEYWASHWRRFTERR
jgi:hypothetical protein